MQNPQSMTSLIVDYLILSVPTESQGQTCSDDHRCCHTEKKAVDQARSLAQQIKLTPGQPVLATTFNWFLAVNGKSL